MSLGSLVLELQANLARTQEDMGRLNQIVENGMRRIDVAAMRTSRNVENIGKAGAGIRRVEGAEEAAKSIEKVGHASTGARRELLVLAHEISQGNFKRAAGSLMVLGERLDIMGKVMSPVGLAIGGVAIALGVFAAAAIKGAEESSAFAKSLLLTGNYAGQTEASYNRLSRAVADATGATIGRAREITQALVSTGRIGAGSIDSVAMAATKFADVTGQKTEEVAKFFERMSDGVLKWAVEANKQYHFVDGALYDHIKALEDAGKVEEAMRVASDAFYQHLGGSAVQNLGYLERAWTGIKRVLSDVKDELLAIGRAETPDDQIAKLKASLARVDSPDYRREARRSGVDPDKARADIQLQLSAAESLKRRQQEQADADATKKAHDSQVVEAKQYWNHLLETTRTGSEEMQRELDKAAREGALAGASPADIAAVQERIRKRYQHGGNTDRADLSATLQPLQDQIRSSEKLFQEQQRVLDRYYKDGKISIEAYYDDEETITRAHLQVVSSLYDQEIAIVERTAARTSDARTKLELQRQAGQLRDERQGAQDAADAKFAELTERKTQDTKAYADEVARLNAELGKMGKNQGEAAGAAFDATHAKLFGQATAAGDTGTLQTLADARNLAVAQAETNDLKAQAAEINERLKITEQNLSLEVQIGAKAELEAQRELGKARADAATQLQAIADKQQQIADASGNSHLETQAAQFNLQVKDLEASSNVLGKTFTNVFENGFAKFLDQSVTRTRNLKQAFLDMANSIEQAITKIIANDLAAQVFGNGSSFGGGSGSWLGQLAGLALSAFGGGATGSEAVGASATSTPDDLISGYRASGGPVVAGGMYEVNERGPELLTVANRTFLMMGQEGGSVTPMGASNARSGNTFHMNIAVPPGTTRQTAQQQASEIMRHAQIAMARNG